MTRGKMISGVSSNRKNETLRQRGYSDAIAGKPRQSYEPAYLVGYRGGTKRREDDAKQ
jgi:hypothetical protein